MRIITLLSLLLAVLHVHAPVNAQGIYDLWINTYYGGASDLGVISRYSPAADLYSVAHSFAPATGTNPNGTLTFVNGKLYGVASAGGDNNAGVLYEYDPAAGTYAVKHHFAPATGNAPCGAVIAYGGKIYGMAVGGGTGGTFAGVIYEYDPAGSGTYTVKHNFTTATGTAPRGSLTVYEGKFYGLANSGGANNFGCLFEYDPGGSGTYTVKHDFNNATGLFPNGSLLLHEGKLYGLTTDGPTGGTLFEYNPGGSGTLTVKHSFVIATGRHPHGSLIVADGKFYGMTVVGGSNSAGVIFEYDPAGSGMYTVKHNFIYATGAAPYGSLAALNGRLYGATYGGGTANNGVLFEYDLGASAYNVKRYLDGTTDGRRPYFVQPLAVPAAVSTGTADLCAALSPVTIDATNNNRWVAITDATGKAVAEINANGNNLGVVNTTVFVTPGAVRTDDNGVPYLNRNITITPATPPGSGTVSVRLYISDAEYSSLEAAAGTDVDAVTDLSVYKVSATCADEFLASGAGELSGSAAQWAGGGYVFSTAVSDFSTFYFAQAGEGISLPVTLSSIKAANEGSYNRIAWASSAEVNLDRYEVERAADGKHFYKIDEVQAADKSHAYTIYDLRPLQGINYYRLRMVDEDVSFAYSKTVTATAAEGNGAFMASAYPNPASNTLQVTAYGNAGNVTVTLCDVAGKVLRQYAMPGSVLDIDMRPLEPGLYFVRCSDGHSTQTLRISKQ